MCASAAARCWWRSLPVQARARVRVRFISACLVARWSSRAPARVAVVAGELVDGRDALADVDERLGRGLVLVLVAVAVAVLEEQVDGRLGGGTEWAVLVGR